ncbi:MAG: PQQ-dependent sugar dehydrogenase [Flavisolibacter sp.]
MPKKPLLFLPFFMLFLSSGVLAQNEPFAKRIVVSGLNSPWEITYGPNDSLWVTENFSYLVKRIKVSNGASTTLLNLSTLKNFSLNDGGRWPQGGLMGLAIHPNLYSSDPATRAAKPWIYLAYVYDRPTGQVCSTDANSSNACNFRSRIVRYEYQGNTLVNPVIILDNMPGSNDHNSGRLTIGPDLKLYYTIGDMGAGQFNNASRTNNAQALDVLEGKSLRLNTESDGDAGLDAWVPDDNPFYNGIPITPRDYVFTMGHRNAQGIVWGNVAGTDRLYNSEHGDKSDDEVNLLVAGGNYGWNEVSGSCDGNYNGLTLGGNSGVDENGFCSSTPTNQQPIKTLYTVNQATINGLSSNNLTWPTVAPSSIEFYGANKIPGWQNSLLVSCLKAGKVFRLKLNASGNGISNYGSGVDTASYFRGEGRFRDLALSPDGLKVYVACDASGQTSGPSGGFNGGGTPPPNAGDILEFTYVGIILPVIEPTLMHPASVERIIKLYPNPVTESVSISIKSDFQKPYTIQMYNATGLFIREIKSSKSEIVVSLAELQSGMYFIQIRNAYDRLLSTEKVIKF